MLSPFMYVIIELIKSCVVPFHRRSGWDLGALRLVSVVWAKVAR